MIAEAYRYRFADSVDLREVRLTLLLSLVAAGGLYGSAKVRMDFSHAVDESIRVLIVDASTEVGRAVNGIFTAFLQCELGDEGFTVSRVARIAAILEVEA